MMKNVIHTSESVWEQGKDVFQELRKVLSNMKMLMETETAI